jgi:hypothetical protein
MSPRVVRIAPAAHTRGFDLVEMALGALLVAAAPVCAAIFVLQSI